jgi:cytochrome P450/NADPH-cytochrome P450 reductase
VLTRQALANLCAAEEWVHTYQKVPTLVDEALGKNGGKRLVDREETDVQGDQIFNKFDDWQENKLWPALKHQFGTHTSGNAGSAKALSMTIDVQSRSSLLRQDTQLGEVAETSLLTGPGMSRKRHIGIRLPSGVTYRAGDYLAVLPLNPPSLVARVQKRFGLPWDAVITIDKSNVTSLPKGHPVSAHDILASMVELEQPASLRVATAVAKSIPDADEARVLEERLAKGLSVPLLELLEDHPQAQFSLAQFLAALPPMRMRQYSISSSPLQDPTIATLTYAVLDAPNRSGSSQNFVGICTTYMERLSVGDRVHVSLKSSRSGFHLPADDSKAIIMACAGTGLAPFRAFVAERATKKANGTNVGPALLFYGCKQPDGDDLYREEFDAWEQQGVVSVRRAFSSKPGDADAGGARRVQDRIWNDREEVAELYQRDAQLYLCGAGTVGAGVEDVMARIRAEVMGEDLVTAKKWVAELKGERYWSDVFS